MRIRIKSFELIALLFAVIVLAIDVFLIYQSVIGDPNNLIPG